MAPNEERIVRWPRWNGRSLVLFVLRLVRSKEGSHLGERGFHVFALLHARSNPLAEACGCLSGDSISRVAKDDSAEIASVPDTPDNATRRARTAAMVCRVRRDRVQAQVVVPENHVDRVPIAILDAPSKHKPEQGRRYSVLQKSYYRLPALSRDELLREWRDVYEAFSTPFLPADGLVNCTKRLEVIPRPSTDQSRVPRSALVLVLLLEHHLCWGERDREARHVSTHLSTTLCLRKDSSAEGCWQC